MGRRGVGAVVLLLAVLSVVVVPQVLRSGLLDGRASRAPFPEPPAIGTCIADAPAYLVIPVVPCSEPHLWEVTERWLAEDPQRSTARDPETCRQIGVVYSGLVERAYGDWTLLVGLDTTRFRAPRPNRVGRTGWTVCVAGATHGQPLSRTLLGAALNPGSLPDQLGVCWADDGRGGLLSASCLEPHPWQILATATVAAEFTEVDGAGGSQHKPSSITTASPSCPDLAATLMQTDDPSRGGALTFVQEQWYSGAADPAAGTTTVACIAKVSGYRLLAGSLIGVGDDPLPWAS